LGSGRAEEQVIAVTIVIIGGLFLFPLVLFLLWVSR
jgi:hypothetical protein